MDLSGLWRIRHDTIFGRALRWPLKQLPPHARVRVLQGPARGMRWLAGSGPHLYWLGGYEVAKARLFASRLRPGDVVFDIGAQAGYYTLIAAGRVGASGQVVAFEPLPRNIEYLTGNIAINHLDNVTVIQKAVSERDGEACLEGDTPSTGRLTDKGLTVRVLSLDSALARGEVPAPTAIKIDVEGAEGAVLRGARRLLSEYHPTLFLATHGEDVHVACDAFLRDCGYQTYELSRDELVAEV